MKLHLIPHNDNSQTVIGESAIVEGDIVSQDPVQLKGHVVGNINVNGGPDAAVAVLSCAQVKGDINAQQAVVDGVVIGNISSKGRIELHASAEVKGNISYTSMAIAHGAKLHGTMSSVAAEAEKAK